MLKTEGVVGDREELTEVDHVGVHHPRQLLAAGRVGKESPPWATPETAAPRSTQRRLPRSMGKGAAYTRSVGERGRRGWPATGSGRGQCAASGFGAVRRREELERTIEMRRGDREGAVLSG